MAELETLFSWFCGQWTEHTWRPGGLPLPFCQRCTGLYVGACVAIVLEAFFRQPISRRRLWLDSLLILQIVPFGYHWLPQNDWIRTLTGFLFAFGVVAFLWRLPAEVWPPWQNAPQPKRARLHPWLAALAIAGLPAALQHGGSTTALGLAALGFLGWLGLALLLLLNVGLIAWSLVRTGRFPWPQRRGTSTPSP